MLWILNQKYWKPIFTFTSTVHILITYFAASDDATYYASVCCTRWNLLMAIVPKLCDSCWSPSAANLRSAWITKNSFVKKVDVFHAHFNDLFTTQIQNSSCWLRMKAITGIAISGCRETVQVPCVNLTHCMFGHSCNAPYLSILALSRYRRFLDGFWMSMCHKAGPCEPDALQQHISFAPVGAFPSGTQDWSWNDMKRRW